MSKIPTLEKLLKSYNSTARLPSTPLSFESYKHKNGLSYGKKYSDAVKSLFASSKKSMSGYGLNKDDFVSSGLQKSGYAKYVDKMASDRFTNGLASLANSYGSDESAARDSYAGYLTSYENKKSSLRSSVMSHLINNEIVDMNTAVAYGMSAGLSEEDATLVGRTAYEVTRQKVLNNILEQAAGLGLDKTGAEILARKMGLSEEDAKSISEEVYELLDYYSSISDDYLEFLEQRANGMK